MAFHALSLCSEKNLILALAMFFIIWRKNNYVTKCQCFRINFNYRKRSTFLSSLPRVLARSIQREVLHLTNCLLKHKVTDQIG